MGFAEDRYLLFLHRLQDRRLGLRRRTVDLIREHHMGEYRSLFELKLAAAIGFGQNLCADDVGRHQIRCELNALEGNTEDVTQGFYQQGLAQTRYPLQQDVSAGKKGNQHLPNDIIVTDDNFSYLGLQPSKDLLKFLRLHQAPFLDQRMMPRYSRGNCCFSIGASGTWAGNGALLTGVFGKARVSFDGLLILPSPLVSAANSSGNCTVT